MAARLTARMLSRRSFTRFFIRFRKARSPWGPIMALATILCRSRKEKTSNSVTRGAWAAGSGFSVRSMISWNSANSSSSIWDSIS